MKLTNKIIELWDSSWRTSETLKTPFPQEVCNELRKAGYSAYELQKDVAGVLTKKGKRLTPLQNKLLRTYNSILFETEMRNRDESKAEFLLRSKYEYEDKKTVKMEGELSLSDVIKANTKHNAE